MNHGMTIAAGTTALDVIAMLGWTIELRQPTPRERLLHGLRELLEERRWDAEKQRLREAGFWWGDE